MGYPVDSRIYVNYVSVTVNFMQIASVIVYGNTLKKLSRLYYLIYPHPLR